MFYLKDIDTAKSCFYKFEKKDQAKLLNMIYRGSCIEYVAIFFCFRDQMTYCVIIQYLQE